MITFILPVQNSTHEFRWVCFDSLSVCAGWNSFACFIFEIFVKNSAREARIHDQRARQCSRTPMMNLVGGMGLRHVI